MQVGYPLKKVRRKRCGAFAPFFGGLGAEDRAGGFVCFLLNREVPRSRAKNDKSVTKRREKLQIGYKMVTN